MVVINAAPAKFQRVLTLRRVCKSRIVIHYANSTSVRGCLPDRTGHPPTLQPAANDNIFSKSYNLGVLDNKQTVRKYVLKGKEKVSVTSDKSKLHAALGRKPTKVRCGKTIPKKSVRLLSYRSFPLFFFLQLFPWMKRESMKKKRGKKERKEKRNISRTGR